MQIPTDYSGFHYNVTTFLLQMTFVYPFMTVQWFLDASGRYRYLYLYGTWPLFLDIAELKTKNKKGKYRYIPKVLLIWNSGSIESLLIFYINIFPVKGQDLSECLCLMCTVSLLSCLYLMMYCNLTCQTPTQALAIRMSKITKGSTKAVIESSSSKKAST